MHRLENVNGSLINGPRLFTTTSVRGILHNSFYAERRKLMLTMLDAVYIDAKEENGS